MLGVCGGYENDDIKHCGHVFSNFTLYNRTTKETDAMEIIEIIGNYWKERAKEFLANN